jgi:hypothetical protein
MVYATVIHKTEAFLITSIFHQIIKISPLKIRSYHSNLGLFSRGICKLNFSKRTPCV